MHSVGICFVPILIRMSVCPSVRGRLSVMHRAGILSKWLKAILQSTSTLVFLLPKIVLKCEIHPKRGHQIRVG